MEDKSRVTKGPLPNFSISVKITGQKRKKNFLVEVTASADYWHLSVVKCRNARSFMILNIQDGPFKMRKCILAQGKLKTLCILSSAKYA